MLRKIAALRNVFRQAWRALSWVAAIDRRGFGALCALQTLDAVLLVLLSWVGKVIVDSVVLGQTTRAWQAIVCELVIVSIRTAIGQTSMYLESALRTRVQLDVGQVLIERAASMSYERFRDEKLLTELDSARQEGADRITDLALILMSVARNSLSLVGLIALLSTFGAVPLLVLSTALLPAFYVEIVFGSKMLELRTKKQTHLRRAGYLAALFTSESTIKEVKMHALSEHFKRAHRREFEGFARDERRLHAWRAVNYSVLTIAGMSALYALYAHLALAAAGRLLAVGSITLFLFVIRAAQTLLQSNLSLIARAHVYTLISEQTLSIRHASPNEPAPANRERSTQNAPEIVVDKVSVRIGDHELLSSIDLTLPPGSVTIILGGNGAGKTTLLKVLAGLIRPHAGCLRINGRELSSDDLTQWRARVGAHFADSGRFDFTVGENVGIGWLPDFADKSKQASALQATSFSLPLETEVGTFFGGRDLSSGEWQRLRLARSLFADSRVMLLDEPTNALDFDSEVDLWNMLLSFRGDRTLVIVTHKPTRALQADRVVVLKNGRIIEQAAPADLSADPQSALSQMLAKSQ